MAAYTLTVPLGLTPGDQFQADVGGVRSLITVPPGVNGNQTIQVQAQGATPAPVVAVPATAVVHAVGIAMPTVAGVAVTAEFAADAFAKSAQDNVKLIDAQTAGILATVNDFTINQRVKFWETLSGGCFEQKNTYDVFDSNTKAHLFIVQEDSHDCARLFCAPAHSLHARFKLVNAVDRLWATSWFKMAQDLCKATAPWPTPAFWEARRACEQAGTQPCLAGRGPRAARATLPVPALNLAVLALSPRWATGAEIDEMPTAFTADRVGCCTKPFLGCWICCEACKDGVYVHAGEPPLPPGMIAAPADNTIGYATQPDCGGYFTPTINLHERVAPGTGYEGFVPLAKVEGPCVFGGCSELCGDSWLKVAPHPI